MQKQAIITVVGTPMAENNAHGLLYKFEIELSNGDRGRIMSKSPTPNFLGAGMSLDYMIDPTGYIKRVKPAQPGGFPQTTPQQGYTAPQQGYSTPQPAAKSSYPKVGIVVGSCLGLAVQMVTSGTVTADKLKATAEKLIKMSLELEQKYANGLPTPEAAQPAPVPQPAPAAPVQQAYVQPAPVPQPVMQQPAAPQAPTAPDPFAGKTLPDMPEDDLPF